jgi:surface protein
MTPFHYSMQFKDAQHHSAAVAFLSSFLSAKVKQDNICYPQPPVPASNMNETIKKRSFQHVQQARQYYILPEELFLPILSHFHVTTLIEKKQISRHWCTMCTAAIDSKQTIAFRSNEELRSAVRRYCGYDEDVHHDPIHEENNPPLHPHEAEDFACTYGWPINRWNVSNLEDFSYIFDHLSVFNENISSWDMHKAKNTVGMFRGALSFNNDISTWNVSNVKHMDWMFHDAVSFNQSLSTWNVSNVITMEAMFHQATLFNGDISNWDVSNVTDMGCMFMDATMFNGNIENWDVSRVRNMTMMFFSASSFNRDLSNWSISSVRSMNYMFVGATAYPWNRTGWGGHYYSIIYSKNS